jgi:hypothetical protein
MQRGAAMKFSAVPRPPRELRRGMAFGLDFLGELLDLDRGQCP